MQTIKLLERAKEQKQLIPINICSNYEGFKHSKLQADISELERKIANYNDNKNLSDGLHQ